MLLNSFKGNHTLCRSAGVLAWQYAGLLKYQPGYLFDASPETQQQKENVYDLKLAEKLNRF